MKPSSKKKLKYTPSLAQIMGQCTLNYIQLMKLLPNIRQLERLDQISFQLVVGNTKADAATIVTCLVTEAAPYTTFLTFTQMTESGGLPASLALEVKFSVRLYHDAQLAEVVDAERNAIIPGRMDYPNTRMLHVDEKAQCNLFFSEWLAYCKRHGIAICDFDLSSSALPVGYHLEGTRDDSDVDVLSISRFPE